MLSTFLTSSIYFYVTGTKLQPIDFIKIKVMQHFDCYTCYNVIYFLSVNICFYITGTKAHHIDFIKIIAKSCNISICMPVINWKLKLSCSLLGRYDPLDFNVFDDIKSIFNVIPT